MKETGIVRKLDKMGRIVIPKELRWKYRLECGDMVEIYTQNDCICVQKYETETDIMEQVDVLFQTVEQMEQELKNTKELEDYLKQVKDKLDKLQTKV